MKEVKRNQCLQKKNSMISHDLSHLHNLNIFALISIARKINNLNYNINYY